MGCVCNCEIPCVPVWLFVMWVMRVGLVIPNGTHMAVMGWKPSEGADDAPFK